MEEILNSTEEKMMLTIESLENKFTNVRAGRANPNMLDGIMVEYYGVPTPLKSLANYLYLRLGNYLLNHLIDHVLEQ